MTDNLIIAREEIRQKLLDAIISKYIDDSDPVRHENLVRICGFIGAIRCGLIAAKHTQLPSERKEGFVRTMRQYAFTDADEMLKLMRETLW